MPVSHLDTVCGRTESLAASSACVSPAARRRFFKFSRSLSAQKNADGLPPAELLPPAEKSSPAGKPPLCPLPNSVSSVTFSSLASGHSKVRSGSLSPRSHFPTACGVTPRRMARHSCVNPRFFRYIRMMLPIPFIKGAPFVQKGVCGRGRYLCCPQVTYSCSGRMRSKITLSVIGFTRRYSSASRTVQQSSKAPRRFALR